MGNLIIARPHLSDMAAVTAGSAAGTMPASNLQRRQPTDVWRATDLAAAWVRWDLGASTAIRLVAMLYTNASADALWRVTGATSVANLTNGSHGYRSDWLPHYPVPDGDTPPTDLDGWARTHALLWLDAAVSYRYWLIEVDDLDNPAGYYQAGRAYLSNPWQAEFNPLYGAAIGIADDTTVERSRGGQTFPSAGARRRDLGFTIPIGNDAELYGNAQRLDREVGNSRDCLIVTDPDDRSWMMERIFYARLTGARQVTDSNFAFREKVYTAEEWEHP